MVDSSKATELIMDKLNEYLYSDKYDPTKVYQINKRLLDIYMMQTALLARVTVIMNYGDKLKFIYSFSS